MPRLPMPMPRADRAMRATCLPSPPELAALGTVLCLYRARSGGELGGWRRALHVEAAATVDSDGMREALVFRDATGDCCWQLFLLPDTDFLAWERLAARLPLQRVVADARAGLAERMLQRLSGRTRHGEWQASVLRLHARRTRHAHVRDVLAATVSAVSPLGAAAARTIARSQHADVDALRDDCCCARAASASNRDAAQGPNGFPHLVRLPRPDAE